MSSKKNEKEISFDNKKNYYEIIADLKGFVQKVKNSKSVEDLSYIMPEIQGYIFRHEDLKGYYVDKVNKFTDTLKTDELENLKNDIMAVGSQKNLICHMWITQFLFFEYRDENSDVNVSQLALNTKGIVSFYEQLLKESFTIEIARDDAGTPYINPKYANVSLFLDFYVFSSVYYDVYQFGFRETRHTLLYLQAMIFGVLYDLIYFLDNKANKIFYGELANVYLKLLNLKKSSNELFEFLKELKEQVPEKTNRANAAKTLHISTGALDKKCQKFCEMFDGLSSKGLEQTRDLIKEVNFNII